MSDIKVPLNKWFLLNKGHNNETEVMYLGAIGLIRTMMYVAPTDSDRVSMVKIDARDARAIIQGILEEHDE